MSRTVRITLDIEVRPLTEDELEFCGIDQLDEDCRPSGTDDDLDDASAFDLAEILADGLHSEAVQEMFAGTDLYMIFESAKPISAEWVGQ